MSLSNRRTVRGVVVGVALLGLAGITPAYAEGSWSSNISGWTRGDESRRWDDRNSDGVSTSVGFGGCVTDSANGFNNATLQLWKDVFGPDEEQGVRTNYCNSTHWGDKAAAKYYFELWGLGSGRVLSVNSVYTQY
ncbi:hypothetical protein [Streptomyces sp. NPDC057939]|uniref:hypothetical protein n=1 Tax=Streptomyces sp. NPDC057939 TaxID=3346284 RepID=UPI0036EBB77C